MEAFSKVIGVHVHYLAMIEHWCDKEVQGAKLTPSLKVWTAHKRRAWPAIVGPIKGCLRRGDGQRVSYWCKSGKVVAGELPNTHQDLSAPSLPSSLSPPAFFLTPPTAFGHHAKGRDTNFLIRLAYNFFIATCFITSSQSLCN